MSAKQNKTAARLTVEKNVENWRKAHRQLITITIAEMEERDWHRQIKQGRLVCIGEAWPS